MYLIVQVTVFVLFAQNVHSGTSLTSIRRVSGRFPPPPPFFRGSRFMEIASKSPLFAYLQQYPCPPSTYPSLQAQRPPMCDRVNLRGNRIPDPWHMSPHSNAISQRQLPLAKGFGQCRHSCYRQTQVMCCRLVVGSATYTTPRNGTCPRVLIMVTCTWTKGRFSDLSNVPAPRWAPM